MGIGHGFDFVSHATALQRATRDLRERWDDWGESWRDGVRERFDQRHIRPLDPRLRAAVTEIHQFAELVRRMVKQLEEDEP